MAWSFNSSSPIYLQIVKKLESRIISGEYSPGIQLPAVRDLAVEAGVNPNTMQRALSDLERENLVFSVRTSGRFVTEDQSVILVKRKELAETLTSDYLQHLSAIGCTAEDAVILIKCNTEDKQ